MSVSRAVTSSIGRAANRAIYTERRPFNPLDIPGLKLWLDASDINTVDLRLSQYVTTWYDKSGNGNHFSQSTPTNQPEYQLNQQNGRATISVNDVNLGHLTCVNDFITTDTGTWFFVFQSDLNGIQAAPTLMADYVQQAANPIVLVRSENKGSQDVFFARDAAGNSLRVRPILVSTYSLLICTRKPGRLDTDYNGATAGLSGAYGSQIYAGGGPTPMLGSQPNLVPPGANPVTQMKGHIAEVLYYGRELNSSEKDRLKNSYLKPRWAL